MPKSSAIDLLQPTGPQSGHPELGGVAIDRLVSAIAVNLANDARILGAIRAAIAGEDVPPRDHRRDVLMRLPEVMRRTGLSRSTIYDKIGAGTFPKQVSLGANMVAWYESAVDAWIRNPPSGAFDRGALHLASANPTGTVLMLGRRPGLAVSSHSAVVGLAG